MPVPPRVAPDCSCKRRRFSGRSNWWDVQFCCQQNARWYITRMVFDLDNAYSHAMGASRVNARKAALTTMKTTHYMTNSYAAWLSLYPNIRYMDKVQFEAHVKTEDSAIQDLVQAAVAMQQAYGNYFVLPEEEISDLSKVIAAGLVKAHVIGEW